MSPSDRIRHGSALAEQDLRNSLTVTSFSSCLTAVDIKKCWMEIIEKHWILYILHVFLHSIECPMAEV